MQFVNQQDTTQNIKLLKACLIILSMGRLETKTIRQAIIAFHLMERYLAHFEDNYMQMLVSNAATRASAAAKHEQAD